MNYEWRPYVPVAERRRKAVRAMTRLAKKGQPVLPVVIEGSSIARSFWGKAWCKNLESYSDYSNRLPRGRTYVRNGSVLDLQIAPREVQALVSGSKVYKVTVSVSALPQARWKSICRDCSGAIDSLVELLQGRFSQGVMKRICQQKTGLFPAPAEIKLACSCPDWAEMCKHVAAVLYGIGARLDDQPELLFRLRDVAETDLIATAGGGLSLAKAGLAPGKLLPAEGLSELFGLDMATETGEPGSARAARKPASGRRSPKKSARVKAATRVARKPRRRASPPPLPTTTTTTTKKKKKTTKTTKKTTTKTKKKKPGPKPGARRLPKRNAKQPRAPE